ncbi:MAG: NAD(P)H-hydrate dehydratase [Syntrophales bacterium]|jgi:NAD(P)H-hydrate epimerase|nr:NAD(P)H-hydrate dehydratase [Syntrophales bacterium]MDY0044227.1 NAD(P)H-hydrate dehydratase [Syntrophales bacterium]
MKVSRVSEMRELDKEAVNLYGIDELQLMENAGEAAWFVILKEMGNIYGKKFLVICGIGNNGGDGFVTARKLHSNGAIVKVIILGDASKFTGAAQKNYEIAKRLSIDIAVNIAIDEIKSHIHTSDAIVDAIFGTGITRKIEGVYSDVINLVNQSPIKTFCVDIPSGVNGDTGEIMGAAVKGDYTITFGLPKVGMLFYPGYTLCGKIYLSHISFPPAHYNKRSLKIAVNIPPPIPSRNVTGHKGSFGDVLFIAGAAGYYGAPYLSSFSFLHAGGGYSRLAVPRSIAPVIASKGNEIVCILQEETPSGSISYNNIDRLLSVADQSDFIVIGPGLSLEEETQRLVRDLVQNIQHPLLIDGDGITAMCRNIEILAERKSPTILTPHLGEMSRLTGLAIHTLDEQKIEILQKTAEHLNSIIILKGAHSLIGMPDGRIYINLSGNSGMATAGSGDVLAGTIASMVGLGLRIEEAVQKGVFIHGYAGDLAAECLGEDGITASKLIDFLPIAVKKDREGVDWEYAQRYSGVTII